jgi:hypothetical protein
VNAALLGRTGRRQSSGPMSIDMVHEFLTSMYTNRPTSCSPCRAVFVRSARTPLLITCDDVPAHPYRVAKEVASLTPHAEVPGRICRSP